MNKELLRMVFEAMSYGNAQDRESARLAVGVALAEQLAQQEPVALKWQQAPIRTAWGDDMVVASVAIDNDHTLSLYCERNQTAKVDEMFAQPAQRKPLTDEFLEALAEKHVTNCYFDTLAYARAIEAAHGIKENT